jgi:ABC-type multidrug transport system fused ATPase/permease subunit
MSIVFPALTGFTMLRSTIFDLMWDVSTLTQAYISIGRIQEFFNDVRGVCSTSALRQCLLVVSKAEVLDCYAPDGFADITSSHVGAFGMANMSFAWSATAASDSLASAPAAFRLRIKESLIFKPALNLIIGPTGCGKSSLLLALLGEMHCVPAERGAWINVPRGRGLAYCAQESWVQSMSIRDNILFGSVYEAERYRKGS